MFLLGTMASLVLIVSSCSSEEEKLSDGGKGTIRMNLSAAIDFFAATRAVNLDDFQNKNNYTLQIWKDGTTEAPLYEFSYAEVPSSLEVENGLYRLKAFCGTDFPLSSRSNIYVEGQQMFMVQGDNQSITVDCAPTCAKAVVSFDPAMATYFSDYYVVFETELLKEDGSTAVWAKDDTNPWFLKVKETGENVKATIHFMRKEEYGGVASSQIEKKCLLAPNKAWTLKVIPTYDSNTGKFTFVIEVDESTNDHEIEIIVPSEWI